MAKKNSRKQSSQKKPTMVKRLCNEFGIEDSKTKQYMAKKNSRKQSSQKKPTMVKRLCNEFGIEDSKTKQYWKELLKKERD